MLNKSSFINGNTVKQPASVKDKAIDKNKEMEEVSVETLRQVIDNIDETMTMEKRGAFERKAVEEQISHTLEGVLETRDRHFSLADKQRVVRKIIDEIFGYGPINPLINDPTVTEVMVNGPRHVYVERDGKLIHTDTVFRDDAHVMHIIDKIITPLGRRIDESSPMVDARLPDGSRVNAIIPPLSVKGPTITIRKFSADPFTMDDLITFGTMSSEVAKFLRSCVKSRVNIIVTGGTGSGKTTVLNVLSGFIPTTDRIVTIEDAAELQLQQNHVITLESRPANIEGKGKVSIRDLVINSLRMRPDRIVVGEVRGGEALDMLQAMNTGHDGSITTLHANNPRDGLARLETMVLMAGMDLPLRAIREQISSAINLIVHSVRFSDGSRKITKVTEVVGMEGDTITLQDLFVFEHKGFSERGEVIGSHMPTGIIPSFLDKLHAYGERISKNMFRNGQQSEFSNRRL
ncbi:type II secretion system protein E [Dethiobacter alkaliphilus AHT 1]|uniref:Type II secretion system protein E n=1 Tax=Dethiobacter alkaliphilus AHT 1 TaxID=555088 RepID=C0GEA1_DETAL|nr:CpaF family protein [Dethiobacter alkaliphilus]EEG78395.1 type II secretion system protein E [Dethiobacter alkaliphilus AHT 1]